MNPDDEIPDDQSFTFDDDLVHGYWVQIASDFLRCPKFSPLAKALYGLLLTYAQEKATAFPGQDRLCEELGVTDKPLRGAACELIDAGMLRVKRRGQGKTNLYHVAKWQSRTKDSTELEPDNRQIKNRNISGSGTGISPTPFKGRSRVSRSISPSNPPEPGEDEGFSPTASAQDKRSASRRAAKVSLPKDWAPSDADRAAVQEQLPSIHTEWLEAETQAFCDYARANDARYAEWGFAWRNWIRNAYKRKPPTTGAQSRYPSREGEAVPCGPAYVVVNGPRKKRDDFWAEWDADILPEVAAA